MNIFRKIFAGKVEMKSVKPAEMNIHGEGRISATWLSLNSNYYYNAYKLIPQLRAVVNRLSDAYIRGSFNLVNEKNDIVESGSFFELLQYPNPLQSRYEFWETFYRNYTLFDRVHVFKIQTSFGISSMIVLPTADVKIVANEDFDIRSGLELSDFISHYEFTFKNKVYKLETSDVWTFASGSLKGGADGFLYPDMKLDSLLKPLSNIKVNYKSRNELMKGMGAIGMISSEAKDADGTIPLEQDDVEELQENFRDYRLADGDYKYLITKSALKWTPMTVPVKDMEFFNSLQVDTDAICDVLNYPSVLLASSQRDVKFTNFQEARSFLFTDKIIPDAEKIDFSFNQNFNKVLKTDKLKTEYSHLEILQKDALVTATTNKTTTENISLLNKQIFEGIITKDIAVSQLTQQGYNTADAESVLTINQNGSTSEN